MTPSKPGDLSGSVAIVTGGARNIGRAIASDLAAAGATVIVHARRSKDDAEETVREITENGSKAQVHLADLTDADAVQAMVDDVADRFGGIDILVNNAAQRGDKALEELSFEEFRAVHSSIVDATFLCCKACAPYLKRSDAGAVVNLGGVAAHVGLASRIHVVSAKAAVAGMTRALAAELASHAVTVNCVSPGYVDTKRDHVPPHFRDQRPPLDRPAQPEEIAAAVAFLCGPGARYITGQTLHVNGGWFMT